MNELTPAELVGRRIREARERAGMTQAALGFEMGRLIDRPFSRQSMSFAESGGRMWTAAEVMAAAHVLDVSIAELFRVPVGVDGVRMARRTLTAEDFGDATSTTPEEVTALLREVLTEATDLVTGRILAAGGSDE